MMLPRYLQPRQTMLDAQQHAYHRVLYIDVACARCDGNAISVTSSGAADAANVSPKPIRKRAPMNIPTECDAVCSTVAITISVAPKSTAMRRPRPSVRYAEKGYAARQPMF